MNRLFGALKGDRVRARILRGTGFTIFRTLGGSAMRLASNLILTRLLFPEAFGLMALVQIFIFGLQMFSEVGIHTMLIQSKREDRAFLDTLWTLQILRGIILWLLCCILAYPAAWIYEQPMLAQLLPASGLMFVITGFKTTRAPEAQRKINLERVILIQLTAQFFGLILMALFAWWLQSVWALVIGSLLTSLISITGMHFLLPGQNNKLRWDRQVVVETLNYGIFLFLSSVATFFNQMGAQMVLGAYIPLGLFGIFHIAKQLGSFPQQLAQVVARNVIFPLYRMKAPASSGENQQNVFTARRLVAVSAIFLTAIVALIGDWLIILLFSDEYEAAGPMLVLMALALLPVLAFVGANEALPGSGDSKRFFYLTLALSVVQMVLLVVFVPIWGVVAAILIPPIAQLIAYPYQAYLTNKHKTWDATGECGLIILGLLCVAVITWIKWDALSQLPLSN